MHRVMLIGSLVGSRLAQLCPTSKCPPNPPEPPTYCSLLGIAAEMEYALNTTYCTLNNLGISAERGGELGALLQSGSYEIARNTSKITAINLERISTLDEIPISCLGFDV